MRRTKMKQVTGLAAAVLFSAALLAGCGNDGGTPSESGSQGGENQDSSQAGGNTENSSQENSSSESGSQENENSGDVVTIKYLRPGTAVEHNDELVQAINDKLAADGTGLQLEIMYVPSDVFSDKVNMMLQGGDEFDLLAVMEDQKSFTTYIGAEGIIPITQYVKDSEVLNRVIPQYMWESATVGGEIYTIPANWTENADQACCITIRREKLEEFGLEDPKTMEDLLNMCQVFTEKWDGPSAPVIIPMYKEPFTWLFRTLDTYPFTVQKDLIFIDQEGNVKNWVETDEFRQTAEFFRTCYEKGYIPEDVLSSSWSSWNTMLTGDFIWVDGCQLWGTEEVWNERIQGTNLDTIYLNPDAASFRPASFRNDTAVSVTSKHPAEAVKFMEWVYSSQENYDLMVYGVEGLTWKNEGEGLYTKLIPDFEFNADWMIGNMEYERYEVGTYQKFIDIMGEEKPDAENSIVLNFVFDPASVATEYANCLAEVEAKVWPIKLGIISMDEGYEDALAKLKAAGIEKVVEEYQRQLDEYLAAQE